MNMKRKMLRQGDVLLVEVTGEIPSDAKEIARDKGKVVVAYGEVTGHSHAIASKGATLFAVNENLRLLRIEDAAELQHEEHATIKLPAKTTFQVIQQKEYIAGRIMNVAD
jgi:hypothetical protein